ncbi:MAG: hypothetical protein HZB57_09700 [Gammaproteobacteria bacterium]|nr:hypothetical protein [Gammaproteobacteria bacterium]
MASALELYDSRISRIDEADGIVSVHFSHAYIHKSSGAPNTIAEGFLEVGGIRHELIPLPFKRKVAARLVLVFVDGAQIEIVGNMPVIELKGNAIFLEDFS